MGANWLHGRNNISLSVIDFVKTTILHTKIGSNRFVPILIRGSLIAMIMFSLVPYMRKKCTYFKISRFFALYTYA